MAKNKNNALMWVLGIVVVVLVLNYAGYINLGNLAQSISPNAPAVNQPSAPANQVPTCEQSSALTLTYSTFDENPAFASTSRIADYNLVYYFDGVLAGHTTGAAAISTVPTGTLVTIEAVPVTDSTSYGFSDSVQMGCQSVVKAVNKGARSGALTQTSYDVSTGTNTANAVGTPTTIGAGQSIQGMLFSYAGTPDTRFGTAESGAQILVVFDYNSTVEKQPVISKVLNGTAVLSNVPTGHSTTGVVGSATASVAYLISTSDLQNLGTNSIYWHADAATATANPSATDGNVGFTVYDKQLYQRSTGTWETGFRNADSGADIGRANATTTFYII